MATPTVLNYFKQTVGESKDNTLVLGGNVQIAGVTSALYPTIALARSLTTDGMQITVTFKDGLGATVADVIAFEMWMSEDANGIGLTADAYSGTLTAGTGAILTALTAKKHVSAVTAATGIAVFTLVDSANPVDQYVAVKNPLNGAVYMSAISANNWEGAA